MHLTSSGDRNIVYGFDTKPRTIAGDLAGLKSGSDVKATMADRGFQVTESYKQYHSWMQRQAKFRPKAMDIFNQTVAVKDVQRLDQFIREHMLEKKPWNNKVSNLLKHFAELSEAHRALVQVRQQSDLLVPIMKAGERYRKTNAKLQSARDQLAASGLYFDVATERLLRPLCERWCLRIEHLGEQIGLLDDELKSKRSEAAAVELEIQHSGGDRLRKLPHLIERQEQFANSKRDKRLVFESKLKQAGIQTTITSTELLAKAHQQILQKRDALTAERATAVAALENQSYQVGVRKQQLADDESELESLRRRKGNLPDAFIELRAEIGQAFKLSPSDLPFAAELIAVDPEYRRWESTIEQVLHSFARTLLVPDDLYAKVSGYVDSQRLTDSRGRGLRLTYDRVGGMVTKTNQRWTQLSLPDMLHYRDDHPLMPYVRGEILSRFDHLACESIADFQQAARRAMTIHRHVKQNQRQHAKDDRSVPDDRRAFVLGWDNKAKREALERSTAQQRTELVSIEAAVVRLRKTSDRATELLGILDELAAQTEFDTMDDSRHDYEASQLRLEKHKLESSNDQMVQLKSKLAALYAEVKGLDAERDRFVGERSKLDSEVATSGNTLTRVDKKIAAATADGRLASFHLQFEEIDSLCGERKLTLANLGVLPRDITDELSASVTEVERRIDPVRNELTKAMGRLLQRFPVFETELDPAPQALPSFEALAERINKDDLPRHERRFKQRLKEKVLQEIGLLHGSLEDEREEIRSKIETLNEALRQLEWKTDTYMRLEPTDTADAEIRDFRRELAGCLEGTLSGADEANEATFQKIEKLVDRLRDDANLRWREKVIDVRNWFKFAAREYDKVTGEAGSYYDGGTGQSGGEKGKLAFLVLVAAIAYQYDLQLDDPDCDRFHFVMVDEMFSRSDDTRAKYALNLFAKFNLQLAIVAPLDAKARITESYVGTYGHIIKNPDTHRSELICLTAEQYQAVQDDET